MEFEVRGNPDLVADRLNRDPIAQQTITAVRREKALYEGTPPPGEFAPLNLASISFPLSRRTKTLPAPSIETPKRTALERGQLVLGRMEEHEFMEMMMKPAPNLRGTDCAFEGMHRLLLLESIMERGGHRKLLERAERSPGDQALQEILHEAAECCAALPERDTGPLLEWVGRNIFKPRGIPLPDDPDKMKREIAVVGSSSMHLHYSLASRIMREGEVCLVPEASFGSLFSVAIAGGGRTEVIPTAGTQYRLTADSLRRSIHGLKSHEKPRLLLLINPTNPGGYSFTERELCELAAVCISKQIVMLVDELYSGFAIPGAAHREVHAGSLTVDIGGRSHRLHDHIVSTWGTSKSFNITKGQLGFATSGNPMLIDGIKEISRIMGSQPTIKDSEVNLHVMKEGAPFLEQVTGPLAEGHRELLNFVCHANAAIGGEMFRLMVTPHSGFYCGLGVMARAAATVGITGSLQLSEYLWRALGIRTTSAESMHVRAADYLYCRINFIDIEPTARTEAFRRLADWGAELWSGRAARVKLEL